MMLKSSFLLVISTLLLLACAASSEPTVYQKDGKVVVHDEAPIPTHTVTQYATVTKTHESLVTPTLSVRELRPHEQLPAIDENVTTLQKRIVIDQTIDARYANMTQRRWTNDASPSNTVLYSSSAAVVAAVIAACLCV